MPDRFLEKYMAIINGKTVDELRGASIDLLREIDNLHDKMWAEFVIQKAPTYDNLAGTYEELWCNYRNKVIVSSDSKNKSYAFHTALGAQSYLDEISTIKI